jgi:hypothetical protein
MQRKTYISSLFLPVALIFGAIIRFYPVITNGFPLNDGGMFYAMVQDLKANGNVLPHFTTYNRVNIPFAYPPFGFYIASLLSTLTPASDLWIFLYLPALVNTISIPVFYKLAKQTLNLHISASLAALIFAFAPRSFLWQIMGGGITRAFGMLFFLLMLWQVTQLFRNYRKKHLVFSIIFGAGAVMSHPQTALHAALGGGLIFSFYGFNKRGIISTIFIGAGTALLTAPWWWTALSRHGLEPFVSAGQTSQRTLESYLSLLCFDGLGDYLLLPVLLLALIGLWNSLKTRKFFFITWILAAYLIDPRGGEGIALLSLSILAGDGLLKLSIWIGRSDGEQVEVTFMKRPVQILLFCLTFYFIMVASIFDFQLINTSLKADDLVMIKWVNENIDEEKSFLLATGHEFSMSDPMQEWFPALTNRYSVTTVQGLEWILGENFFPWYDELVTFQHCADVNCVSEWSERNGVNYDYLVVLIPTESDESELAGSLRNLGVSASSSALHTPVYKSEHALIFELKK